MKKLPLLLAVVAGIFGGLVGAWLFGGKAAEQAHKESAYERVMRTGTLRCGYWNWAPILSVDPKSGKVTGGIFKDYTEALGKSLGLKVVWAKEVGFGTFATDIQQGAVDAVCGGVWPLASRGREMDFTAPVYFIGVKAYVRPDDTRFDHHIERVDDPAVTIAGMDGWAQTAMAAQRFPKARITSLPDNASAAEVYEMVANRKADIVFNDVVTTRAYMEHNPGKLREVVVDRPLGMFGNTIGIGKGEYDLKRMLDNATEQLLYSGIIDQIIDKYEQYPGILLRVARPYERVMP